MDKLISTNSDRRGFLRALRTPTLIIIYGIMLFSIYIIFKPPLLLFDDKFIVENGLFHYIDFRPGYPPLGKLPYTLLYAVFKEDSTFMVLFNIISLNVMLFILYKIASEMIDPRKAKVLTIVTALNPAIIHATVSHLHADMLAAVFLLLSMLAFIKNRPLQVGVYCGLGFMTKIYPAVLLIPYIFQYSFKKRLVLISAFMASIILLSTPFLIFDPLMYVSTFTHHLLRGPSESIFALLDGYYYHTGFLHPTYEATIYAWQFAKIYEPSIYDHFRYEWQHPYLRFLSLTLQIVFLFLFSLMAKRGEFKLKSLEGISLAALTYFAFSTFRNPLITIPEFLLALFTLMKRDLAHQLSIFIPLIVVDSLHFLVWFSELPLNFEFLLLIVVNLKAMLFAVIFLLARPR